MAEIFLKVALNTIILILSPQRYVNISQIANHLDAFIIGIHTS